MRKPVLYKGGATGMATMAMAIALFGTLWPLLALAMYHFLHYIKLGYI